MDKLGKFLGKTYDHPDLKIKYSFRDKLFSCLTSKKKHHWKYNLKS